MVGFLNPTIYGIGKGSSYSSTFHDITTGNNFSASSPSRFSAVVGYDLCTGWGTPYGTNMINALAPGAVAKPGGYITGETLGTLHNGFSGFAGMQIVVGSTPLSITALGRMMVSGNT